MNNEKIGFKEQINDIINPNDLQTTLSTFNSLEVLLVLLVTILLIQLKDQIKLLKPDLLITISIGFLTFIALFFSLLAEKNIKSKLKSFIKSIDQSKDFVAIKYHTNKKKAAELGLSEELESKFEEDLDLFLKAKAMLRLELVLYLGVLSYSASIFLALFNSLILSTVFLFLGLLASFHIITIWLFLTSDQIITIIATKIQ